jgi:dienelactone hydrolase
VLTFKGVAPGRYAIQAFHDENDDMQMNMPAEGYAFGNDAAWPVSFDKAAITVSGDTTTAIKLMHMPGAAAAPARPAAHGAPAPAGATREDVRADGLNAILYRPAQDGKTPALVVLGGSEGGIQASSGVGAGFTKHGYAVLALAYFRDEGLPQTLENIPLEYFDKAVDWLKAQPGIDANAIGVIGGSRGSEAALLLASRRSDIRAAAAFAPSGIVWQGLNFANPMNMGPAWTVDGKALPFVAPDGMAYRPGAAMKPMFDNVLSQADTRPGTNIAVEKINGPVLLVSGKADALWPSFEMGERVVAQLKAKGFNHPVQHLSYETAGHMVFIGDPTTENAASMARTPVNPMLGGTGEANMAAWKDNWPKVVAFFDAALKE